MSKAAVPQFQPRKKPIQERSIGSVEAILQATLQVLLQDGKAKLTTTRVAERAGVSVGTLYQYFPNKNSLLQTVLQQHLDRVAVAMEDACEILRGASVAQMGDGIAAAFVQAKFEQIGTSVALYAVSDDVEGKRIGQQMHARCIKAMTTLFETASPEPVPNARAVAGTLLSAMAGVSRSMLESGVSMDKANPADTVNTMEKMEQELLRLVRSYLQASLTGKENAPPTR